MQCQRGSAQVVRAVQSLARRSSIAAVGMTRGMVNGHMGRAIRMQLEALLVVGVAGGKCGRGGMEGWGVTLL